MTQVGQQERKRLIAAVRRRLSGDKTGHIGELASAILANANLEDIEVYSSVEIADFVRSASALMAKRRPGEHLIRISNPEIAGRSHEHRSVTTIEIVNDNMPFLVDSIIGELEEAGFEIRLVLHPVVAVTRRSDGRLRAFHGIAGGTTPESAIQESLIQIHVSRTADADERARLEADLTSLLEEIRLVVSDWRAMRARVEKAIESYRLSSGDAGDGDREEAIEFLTWLLNDNFTLLGIREFEFTGGKKRRDLKRRGDPGLGILRNPDVRILRQGDQTFFVTPAVRAFLMRPEPVFVTKANIRSRVHRRAYIDYVGIKLYNDNGRLDGELRVIGLFTSTAYNRSPRAIPYLRRKIDRVLELSGFDPGGHNGKALVNVLESYPRDELFHIDDETLSAFASSVLELLERPRIRVLVRPDEFDRYISAIVFVPRDRYNTSVRLRIGAYLSEAFGGHVSAYYPAYPEGTILARVHFIIGREGGAAPVIDQAALEAGVSEITRTWSDHLRFRLSENVPRGFAQANVRRYQDAFPASYRNAFDPDAAIHDITILERLTANQSFAVEFHEPLGRSADQTGLKLFHYGAPLSLSERVPILENMGFRVIAEQTYEVTPGDDAAPVYIHDMSLRSADGSEIDLSACAPLLTECLRAVWYRRAENDGYNSLGLLAGLDWREVSLIRALGRYLQQAGTPYSQRSMWEALRRYTDVAVNLVALFNTRFDPQGDSGSADEIEAEIATALDGVETLQDDIVLRRFVNLLDAMLRTNFFQTDATGEPKNEIVFKFDPKQIDGLPEPRPFREIYLYSPRVEGVHLRFGEVARGGLRWSDRPQDFRTEILGLVKAQQVKNAVIVPVGAKGGFVAKWLNPHATREAFLAEGQEAYRIFIRSMLSITDNLNGETVIPPQKTVRRDGDDPYLVVAADKGTATFSDIANGLAIDHGFWLGDAFASGGSDGYDHKKMGITARGAWEAVKRHFREVDIDVQTTTFTVAGVGDMSGDVFGNGMLLSEKIRLVAAFDHRDIFIDPDPDPAVSFRERQRLFEAPRSSWQDYDRSLIAKGGGVFSRSEKSIPLSPEIRDLLALSGARATPHEVLKAILSASVDLLWFGGVGTYVKAPDERDEEVGDRANDPIRVSTDHVKARVIGEGANLGVTQRGRIAFGMKGGRCNSDAIDNSAGVNTSDVEVNIKIALGAEIRDGNLTLAKRNRLQRAMTDEVGQLVLANNYAQTLAISLTECQGMQDFGFQQRFMQLLERDGRLDRKVEILPDDVEMAERHAAGTPLTRAEIGVLIAYAKITLYEDLLETNLAGEPAFRHMLMRYFPARMRERHASAIENHRLRREIIVTTVTNSLVNRCGATFAMQVADRTGASVDAIIRAYVTAREVFGLRAFHGRIDALDNRISGDAQLELYQAIRSLTHRETIWFLGHTPFDDGVEGVVDEFRPAVEELSADLDSHLPERLRSVIAERTEGFAAKGVPEDIAREAARLPVLSEATPIRLAATAAKASLADTASLYFELGERFRFARIGELARAMSVTDYYDNLALDRASEMLAAAHRRLTISAAKDSGGKGGVEAWVAGRGDAARRVLDAVAGITESDDLTVSRVSVAASILADFAEAQEPAT